MEYTKVFVLLTLTIVCSGLQLKVFEPKRQLVKPGPSLNLTCQVDDGLKIILEYDIKWQHASFADPNNVKTVSLTSQQTLLGEAPPNQYGIEVKFTDNTCNFTLIIKEITNATDGSFICTAVPTKNINDRETLSKEVYIAVANNVEEIAMQFDGEESITDVNSTPMQREEGVYGVACVARGFNPAATLHMYLGDEELETSGSQTNQDVPASKAAGARRYFASTTAARVDLMATDSQKRLRCVAQADFDGAVEMEASVPLVIIALEPEIICSKNASAKPGDLYVKLKCIVKHEKIFVVQYSWEIGNTGVIVLPHGDNQDYNEIHIEHINDTTTEVTLDLYEVSEDSFDTYYYLGVEVKNGKTFREMAQLIRLEPDETSKATRTTALSLLCVLLVLVRLFAR